MNALVVIEPWDKHWCPVYCVLRDQRMPLLNALIRRLLGRGWPVYVTLGEIDLRPYEGARRMAERADLFRPAGPGRAVPWPENWAATGDLCMHAEPTHPPYIAWTAPHPALDLDGLLLGQTFEAVYSNAKADGVDQLVFCGGTLDCCMTCRPYGILSMLRYFDCAVLSRFASCYDESRRPEMEGLLRAAGARFYDIDEDGALVPL